MRESPFKTRQKPLKRTPFKQRARVGGKNVSTVPSRPLKRKVQSISKLKKKLWILCKEITRKKYGNTCFTCGKLGLSGSSWHTGHFIAKSTCSTELAYDLANLKIQCYNCNINKSGNWIAFEEKLGPEIAANLKERNKMTKGQPYHPDWFNRKIEEYKAILLTLNA